MYVYVCSRSVKWNLCEVKVNFQISESYNLRANRDQFGKMHLQVLRLGIEAEKLPTIKFRGLPTELQLKAVVENLATSSMCTYACVCTYV